MAVLDDGLQHRRLARDEDSSSSTGAWLWDRPALPGGAAPRAHRAPATGPTSSGSARPVRDADCRRPAPSRDPTGDRAGPPDAFAADRSMVARVVVVSGVARPAPSSSRCSAARRAARRSASSPTTIASRRRARADSEATARAQHAQPRHHREGRAAAPDFPALVVRCRRAHRLRRSRGARSCWPGFPPEPVPQPPHGSGAGSLQRAMASRSGACSWWAISSPTTTSTARPSGSAARRRC